MVLMTVQISFRDRELIAALQNATAEGLSQAVDYYHSRLLLAVNKQNSAGRSQGSGRRHANSSKPGEPPRRRTGKGQRNIVKEINSKAVVARVGITKRGIHMLYLEQGTTRVAQRPWLVATLMKHKRTIGRLFAIGAAGKVSSG
jgi:transposase InsO family protein